MEEMIQARGRVILVDFLSVMGLASTALQTHFSFLSFPSHSVLFRVTHRVCSSLVLVLVRLLPDCCGSASEFEPEAFSQRLQLDSTPLLSPALPSACSSTRGVTQVAAAAPAA